MLYEVITRIITEMDLSVPVEYITDVSYDELMTKVSSLPDKTAIFFYLFLQDNTGTNYIPVSVLKEVHKRSYNFV